MYIVIIKGALNGRYINSATWIDFKIQDTIINVEESDWIIRTDPLLDRLPPRSSHTILKRYSDIIIFKERESVVIPSSDSF